MRSIHILAFCSVLAWAGDTSVPPRPSASDYPVHQNSNSGTLAAARVPARQIEKMFSADIAREYVVVEVAVYPKDGQSFEVDWFDFGLKDGDTVMHAEKPRDVATPWPEKRNVASPVTVTNETGVVYARSSDPVNGRRSEWGTYEGVGVTNDPRAATPPAPRQGPDPQVVEQRVSDKSLPPGPASAAVAGYLFFPAYAKHKKGPLELQWTKDHESVILRLP